MDATKVLIDAIRRGLERYLDVRPKILETAMVLEGILGRCDSEMGGRGGERGLGWDDQPGSYRTW